MAFARHNIEKRRLIELVRLNPILWDCRLPHYKRSDKKKAVKWNELGRIFSVNGERVQRTFTSLREIFRRELNHEKLLGTRFKSKWEYYDAMAFLKEVIRERKSRERAKPAELQQQQQQQQHNNNSTGIDEYQYFAPNDPNNPNNQQQHQQQQLQPNSQQQQQQLQQTLQQAVLNSPLLLQPLTQQQQHQQQQHQTQLPHKPQQQQHQLSLQPLQIQPDVLLSLNASALSALQKLSTNGALQQQQQQTQLQQQQPPPPLESPHAEELLSTSSASSSPSIYIKDEPDSQDDTISLATTLNEKVSDSPKTPPLLAVSTSKNYRRYTKIGNSILKVRNSRQTRKSLHSASQLVIDEDRLNAADDLVMDDLVREEDDEDDDPDPDVNMGGNSLSAASTMAASVAKVHRFSAREILYTKFGDFLAARLNTLHEASAHDLMNRILLLIAEK